MRPWKDSEAGLRRMPDAKREAASLQVRALEPSVYRRQVTTHVDGHLAREATLGPSAKAVINIAGGVCCSRGDRRGGSEAASRGHRPIRLKPDPTSNLFRNLLAGLKHVAELRTTITAQSGSSRMPRRSETSI